MNPRSSSAITHLTSLLSRPILAPQHVEGMIYMLEHSSMLDIAVRGLIFDEKMKTGESLLSHQGISLTRV